MSLWSRPCHSPPKKLKNIGLDNWINLFTYSNLCKRNVTQTSAGECQVCEESFKTASSPERPPPPSMMRTRIVVPVRFKSPRPRLGWLLLCRERDRSAAGSWVAVWGVRLDHDGCVFTCAKWKRKVKKSVMADPASLRSKNSVAIFKSELKTCVGRHF